MINLQTNFGGGKTHSMLALCHLPPARRSATTRRTSRSCWQGRDLASSAGGVRRVALVGNHISPVRASPSRTGRRSTRSGASWPGSSAARSGLRARSPRPTRPRTNPGAALTELLAAYCARRDPDRRVGRLRPRARSGPTCRLARSTPVHLRPAADRGGQPRFLGALLVVSDPGLRHEVGGAHGLEALTRLQNIVRRVADQWRPASPTRIVPDRAPRLFERARRRAYRHRRRRPPLHRDLRREPAPSSPRTSREADYERRIQRLLPDPPGAVRPALRGLVDAGAVPAHPRRAAADEHRHPRAVAAKDASPLIMPASIPLANRGCSTS